jgi:hypothetical protein
MCLLYTAKKCVIATFVIIGLDKILSFGRGIRDVWFCM